MEFSPEIKKKCNSFANALNNGEAKVRMFVEADFITKDNNVLLQNITAEFMKEKGIKTMFENWLRQKSIVQSELFS